MNYVFIFIFFRCSERKRRRFPCTWCCGLTPRKTPASPNGRTSLSRSDFLSAAGKCDTFFVFCFRFSKLLCKAIVPVFFSKRCKSIKYTVNLWYLFLFLFFPSSLGWRVSTEEAVTAAGGRSSPTGLGRCVIGRVFFTYDTVNRFIVLRSTVVQPLLQCFFLSLPPMMYTVL